MLAWGAVSELPISTLSTADEAITPTPVTASVSDSVRDVIYLVEIDSFQNTST